MALSPEGTPPAPPPPRNDVLPFAIGIVAGLVLGSTVLTGIVVLFGALVVNALNRGNDSYGVLFGICVVPALALAWIAVVQTRKALSFVSGGLIGLAAGLLGGTALCTMMFAGLSGGH